MLQFLLKNRTFVLFILIGMLFGACVDDPSVEDVMDIQTCITCHGSQLAIFFDTHLDPRTLIQLTKENGEKLVVDCLEPDETNSKHLEELTCFQEDKHYREQYSQEYLADNLLEDSENFNEANQRIQEAQKKDGIIGVFVQGFSENQVILTLAIENRTLFQKEFNLIYEKICENCQSAGLKIDINE